jgi:hypothetical protein
MYSFLVVSGHCLPRSSVGEAVVMQLLLIILIILFSLSRALALASVQGVSYTFC